MSFNTPAPARASQPGTRCDAVCAARVSLIRLPLSRPISDAKVLTGRQAPLTEVALVIVRLQTRDGHEGLGFSYTLRTGGSALYELVREIAPLLIGENPDDIPALWDKLAWALASIGQSGLAMHAIAPFDIALWDIKARRAQLPLSRLLGARRDSIPVYNTSGGYLSAPLDQVLDNIDASLAAGIGGIKIKVGQPELNQDLQRLTAIRKKLGDGFPLMVDANQQWDRATALRAGQSMMPFGLTWIEEPLDTYDHQGYAALAAACAIPLSTGEMLSSRREHEALLNHCTIGFLQPDAPPDRRHHSISAGHGSGSPARHRACAPFCDGNPHSPGGGPPPFQRSLDRAFRLAAPAVQRRHPYPAGPHPGAHPARAGAQPE